MRIGSGFVVLAVGTILDSTGWCSERAFAIGSDTSCAVLDRTSLAVSQAGHLRDEVGPRPSPSWKTAQGQPLEIVDVFADLPRHRAFALLGSARLDYMGDLVALSTDDLHILGAMKHVSTYGAVSLVVSPTGDRVYVTFSVEGTGSKARTTVVYDGHSYQPVPFDADTSFSIDPWACFLSNGKRIFTGNQLYDPRTGKMADRAVPIPRNYLPVDCVGDLLLMSGRSQAVTTLLGLFDLSKRSMLKEIPVPTKYAFIPGEWILSLDGTSIVRDTVEIVSAEGTRTMRKTCRLEIYDAQRGVKRADLQVCEQVPPTDVGVVGMSSDSRMLFYRVGKAVVQIDLLDAIIHRRTELSFRPVSVFWN